MLDYFTRSSRSTFCMHRRAGLGGLSDRPKRSTISISKQRRRHQVFLSMSTGLPVQIPGLTPFFFSTRAPHSSPVGPGGCQPEPACRTVSVFRLSRNFWGRGGGLGERTESWALGSPGYWEGGRRPGEFFPTIHTVRAK